MKNMTNAKSNKKTNKGINVDNLHIVDHEGGKYVIVAKIHETLGLTQSTVYNAATRMNKDAISKYVKMIQTDREGARKSKSSKCMEVKGLPYLYEKLTKFVTSDFYSEWLGLVNEKAYGKEELHVVEDIEASASNVVEFPTVDSSQTTEMPTEPSNESEITADLVELAEVIEMNDETNVVETPFSSEYVVVSSDIGNEAPIETQVESKEDIDTDGIFGILEGMTTIIAEHSELKKKTPILEARIIELESKLSEITVNPAEIVALNKELAAKDEEIAKLKAELKISSETTGAIIEKAMKIKKYVTDNQK